ncbi:MAG: MipA/OmpV family protein [Burkholderiaceae bacterium]
MLAALLGANATAADGELVTEAPNKFSYLLGAGLVSSPSYAGSSSRELKLRPVAALRYGRLRISTSGGSALLGFNGDVAGSGVSADLLRGNRLQIGASLRVDPGRSSAGDPALAGLPEVRSTLRGRVSAGYALTPHWALGLSVSQDLLGRDGGATASTSIGYRDRLTPRTEWSASVGLGWADGQHMRIYYGVSAASAASTGYAAFAPGAGLTNAHLGLGITSALNKRWIAFAGLGFSRLLGDAAASPLTRQASSVRATVGLAYRCCD